MTAKADWWVLKPAGESEGSLLSPAKLKDTIIISAGQGSAEDKAIANNQPVTLGGKQWNRHEGPFATQQQAQKASPPSGLQFIGQAIGIVGAAGANAAGGGIPSVSGVGVGNPLSGLAAIGDFFQRLTQANTWIRVGKVIAGGALLLIGLAHITGAGNAVATAARKVPVPV